MNIEEEWKLKGDAVGQYPVVVIYQDKRTFPASWYYKTLDEAKADKRPVEKIAVRKWDSEGREVGRTLEAR